MAKPKEQPKLLDVQKEMAAALRRTTLRPSISGYKPQPHQEAFHNATAKVRLFIGGNRSGKTVGGAAESVMWLSGKHPVHSLEHPPPVRGRAVGIDFENGINRIILPEIARWIPPSLLKNGSWEDSYAKGERTLYLENFSQCEFLSNDQEVSKHAGTSRHFIWLDEECDEAIFNENYARTIDTKGMLWMTVTPLQELSWTYDRLYMKSKAGDKNIYVVEVSSSENAYISKAELELLVDGLNEDEKEARLHGTYIRQSGTIFKDSLSDKNFIDPIVNTDRWSQFLSKWGFIGCLDHGYTNPTAFYVLAYDKEGRVIVCHEYYERGRVVQDNAMAILSRLQQIGLANRLEYIVADPSIANSDPITGTSIQAEYAEHGLYLSLGNNDVHAGLNRMMNRFKKQLIYVTRDCENLNWELPRYRWDKFASRKIAGRRNAKETPMKKDDHGIDAIRYGIMSRPALLGEDDIKIGNILQAPTGITPDGYVDPDLLGRPVVRETVLYDFTLGSEW